MLRNIVALVVSLVLIISIINSKVFAMRDMKLVEHVFCDIEKNYFTNVDENDLKIKFTDKYKVFDAEREENSILIKENKELNKSIKDKMKEAKNKISHDAWKEIRNYKTLINNVKISTGEKVKGLIDEQKENLKSSNYSDESVEKFISVLINTQKLKRESIEFEKNYLHKIDNLI